ncbi:MAG: pyridoxamine 5'-phosphate oxidase family protein [Clostridia bacterium]|nr:pyridoxamine 5'-phosphate oxidase family protein [Clostridia bacterium]
MNEVCEFIRKCGVYYLATVDGDQPRVRAFGTINEYEGKLYIQTGKVKDVAKQIAANPKVELCAFDGTEWLRLSGTLVEDDRIEAQAALLDSYPELKAMYQPGDGNNVVYYFKDAVAVISSFTAPSRTIRI